MDIRSRLFELQDIGYREFTIKLTPTLDPEFVIGVRNPKIRNLAKEVIKWENLGEYLENAPLNYYEEKNLYAVVLSSLRDEEALYKALGRLLSLTDNWATCDIITPIIFKKNKNDWDRIHKIKMWMDSDHTYTRRFAMNMLMKFYLDEDFKEEYLEWVARHDNDEYYINMMVAWYFSFALVKKWDSAIKYIEDRLLQPWTWRKAIQKSLESRRVPEERKEYLRKLRRNVE